MNWLDAMARRLFKRKNELEVNSMKQLLIKFQAILEKFQFVSPRKIKQFEKSTVGPLYNCSKQDSMGGTVCLRDLINTINFLTTELKKYGRA